MTTNLESVPSRNLERLTRILTFLAVSGGAALVSKRERRVVLEVGDISHAAAVASLQRRPLEDEIQASVGALVADVGRHHRLFVRVPAGIVDPAFVDRLRRARDVIERFALQSSVQLPPRGSPPTSATAHAVVFVPAHRTKPN